MCVCMCKINCRLACVDGYNTYKVDAQIHTQTAIQDNQTRTNTHAHTEMYLALILSSSAAEIWTRNLDTSPEIVRLPNCRSRSQARSSRIVTSNLACLSRSVETFHPPLRSGALETAE